LSGAVDPLASVASALADARSYVLSRESPSGGFCVYRSELLDEPNLFDTWHAVGTLGLLGVQVPCANACARFVAAQAVEPQVHALYYRVRSLQALRHPDPQAIEVRKVVDGLVEHLPAPGTLPSQIGGPLQVLRHTVWLKRHFQCERRQAEIVEALLCLEDAGGGFPVPPDLFSTQAVCAVLRLGGHDIPPRTAEYVGSLAVPQFGFRLTANSLSPALETTCAGIQCCVWIHRAVTHARDARRFILACQDGRGGFARAPGALADLACTHLAIKGLGLLCGPFRRGAQP
jgi:hypothetical protein